MENFFRRKTIFLMASWLAVFCAFQSPVRTQERMPRAGRRTPPEAAATAVGRLGLRLKYYRTIGDLENARRLFLQLFPAEAALDPETAAKSAGAPLSNRIETAAEDVKEAAGYAENSPVFFSPEHEKNPSADVWSSDTQDAILFAAAEQWAGGWPRDIRIRKSSDNGMSWPETLVIGDGRPWTQPSLRRISDTEVGVAFVKKWDGWDRDIHFVRLSGDLTSDAAFPVALSRLDQSGPSVASDFPVYPAPYVYMAYAEHEGPAHSVKFRVSQDLGASWSRAMTIASFINAGGADVETAIAFDPERVAIHVAYTCPQGPSDVIAVATSMDFGASWSRPVFVTPNDGRPDSSPKIAAKGGFVFIAYVHDDLASGRDIGLAYSRDSGREWTTAASPASSAAAEGSPDVRASQQAGSPKFFVSYVEDNTRVIVASCEALDPGSWTIERTFQSALAPIDGGSIVVLPIADIHGKEGAGAVWSGRNPDYDIYFGSALITNDRALAGVLSLTPAAGLTSTGPVGGSFAPASLTYTLTNSGDTVIGWTATKTQTWTALSATTGTLNAGASTTVAVSIGPAANTLFAGTYNDTVNFTNTTDGAGNAARSVVLTVTTPGALSVTPIGSLASTGPVGGPFAPASLTYTLTNTGGTAIGWTATKTQTWTALSATTGTLGAGASTTVAVSIGPAANTLIAGTYNDTVSFINTSNGAGNAARSVVLTVTTPGVLSVAPIDNLASTGPVGGPFAPASLTYTLTNTGGTTISWTATKTQTWTALSATTGTLGAGASTTVAVSIGPAANTLIIGTYNDTVNFTNASNGAGNAARSVVLTVTTPGVLSVAPIGNLASTGPVGGPFAPASLIYTLTNTGGTAIGWTATKTQTWTALSATTGTLGAGASTTVAVSIGPAANTLIAGTYNDTVNFTNTSNGVGNAARSVVLTITTPGALSVTPIDNLASTGPVGGPFAPASLTYTLTNTGGTAIGWTATKIQTWTTLSATTGTLGAGASTTVAVSIGPAANTLVVGTYNDTVNFTNTANGTLYAARSVVLTVTTPGALSVTPIGSLASTGPVGGPFAPASLTYTLTNTGGTAIGWTATKTQTWTTLSATTGTLGAGASTTVAVSIGPAANTLIAGTYNDTVNFTNTANGTLYAARSVVLTVSLSPNLSVTPASRDVDFTAGTTTFEVSNSGGGTMTWTASVLPSGDWLTLISGASGTNSGTVTVGFTVNPTASVRLGVIRLTATGVAGSPKDVTVIQAKSSIGLSLSAQRLIEKAWIIQREYGKLAVSVTNQASIPVGKYVIYRRSGSQAFQVLQEILGSSVAASQWIYNDAFLEPGTSYTYKIIALDVLGSVISESNEIAI